MIAGTIATVVITTSVTVLVVETVHPEADTVDAMTLVGDTLAALIALLAGFLAGRTSSGSGVTDEEGP
jgi:hypothetical protein